MQVVLFQDDCEAESVIVPLFTEVSPTATALAFMVPVHVFDVLLQVIVPLTIWRYALVIAPALEKLMPGMMPA